MIGSMIVIGIIGLWIVISLAIDEIISDLGKRREGAGYDEDQ
jgi:hypothetical protein